MADGNSTHVVETPFQACFWSHRIHQNLGTGDFLQVPDEEAPVSHGSIFWLVKWMAGWIIPYTNFKG